MVIAGEGSTWTHTVALDELPVVAEAAIEESAYVSLNRFHGPRRVDRLAALNALDVDLDYHRVPRLARACAGAVPPAQARGARGRGRTDRRRGRGDE